MRVCELLEALGWAGGQTILLAAVTPPAVIVVTPNHQLAGAPRQPNVSELVRGELADPDAGEHQQHQDRATSTRGQPIGITL